MKSQLTRGQRGGMISTVTERLLGKDRHSIRVDASDFSCAGLYQPAFYSYLTEGVDVSEPQTPCTCPRCGYTSVQAPLVVCPQCGARDTRPAGFSLTCGKILVGLAVLSMIAWISAMIYPIAAPILLLLGVLLLARPSLVSVLHRAPGKYFVLPWFSRRSPRVAGAVLVAWSLGSSTVGYASYVGSGSVHVGYQHATATAIARQHLSATAVAEAHARATADTQASATADAQASATAAVEATRSAVVRAHATDTAAAHTRQTAIAVALVQCWTVR